MSDLTLICEKCGFPIIPGKGSIYATYREIHENRGAEREHAERHPAGAAIDILDFIAGPGPVHWHTRHDKCSEHREEDSYEIGADQITSWRELAHWTAHLMEKNWLAATDWDDLLHEVAGDRPSRRIRVAAREAA